MSDTTTEHPEVIHPEVIHHEVIHSEPKKDGVRLSKEPKEPKEQKKGKPSKYGGSNVKNTDKYSKEGRQRMKDSRQDSRPDNRNKGEFRTVPNNFNLERQSRDNYQSRERFVRIPEQKFLDLCVDIEADILPSLPAGLRKSFYESIIEIRSRYLKKE
jgi:hypothetical protein